MGPITGPFGARIDPFNGEGAFHSGIDISCRYGQPILAPADGVVTYAGFYSGYGRMIAIDHGNGITHPVWASVGLRGNGWTDRYARAR